MAHGVHVRFIYPSEEARRSHKLKDLIPIDHGRPVPHRYPAILQQAVSSR